MSASISLVSWVRMYHILFPASGRQNNRSQRKFTVCVCVFNKKRDRINMTRKARSVLDGLVCCVPFCRYIFRYYYHYFISFLLAAVLTLSWLCPRLFLVFKLFLKASRSRAKMENGKQKTSEKGRKNCSTCVVIEIHRFFSFSLYLYLTIFTSTPKAALVWDKTKEEKKRKKNTKTKLYNTEKDR